MMEPQNEQAAPSFLGFVGYLSKFIKNLSELAQPIREVCKNKIYVGEATTNSI